MSLRSRRHASSPIIPSSPTPRLHYIVVAACCVCICIRGGHGAPVASSTRAAPHNPMSHQAVSPSREADNQLLQSDGLPDRLKNAAAVLPEGCNALVEREQIGVLTVNRMYNPVDANLELVLDTEWDEEESSSVRWERPDPIPGMYFHVRVRALAGQPWNLCALQYVTDGAQHRGPSEGRVSWVEEDTAFGETTTYEVPFQGNFSDEPGSLFTPPEMNTILIDANPVYRLRFWVDGIPAEANDTVILKEILLWADDSPAVPMPVPAPTLAPTPVQVPVPSVMPTPIPTPMPTPVSTAQPSAMPSSVSTAQPSSVSTAQPSSVSTAQTSSVSTAMPSALPSLTPTVMPTDADATPTPMPTPIPTPGPTYVLGEDDRFRIFYERMTFDDARASCQNLSDYSYNWDLASIASEEENDRILGLFNASQVQDNDSQVGIWIGLSFSDEITPPGYEWLDGASFGYSSWGVNEPDGRSIHNCTSLDPLADGRWAIFPCEEERIFACRARSAFAPIPTFAPTPFPVPAPTPTPTEPVAGAGGVNNPDSSSTGMEAWVLGVITGASVAVFCCMLFAMWKISHWRGKKKLPVEGEGEEQPGARKHALSVEEGVIEMQSFRAKSEGSSNTPSEQPSSDADATSSDASSGRGRRDKLYQPGGDAGMSMLLINPEGNLEGSHSGGMERHTVRSESTRSGIGDVSSDAASPESPSVQALSPTAESTSMVPKAVTPTPKPDSRRGSLEGIAAPVQEKSAKQSRNKQPLLIDDRPPTPPQVVMFDSDRVADFDEDEVSSVSSGFDSDEDGEAEFYKGYNSHSDYSNHVEGYEFNTDDELVPAKADSDDEAPIEAEQVPKAAESSEVLKQQLNLFPGAGAGGDPPNRKIHQRPDHRRCTVCGTNFDTPVQLVAHLKEKHNIDRGYTCDVCRKLFARKYNMEVHRRTHMKASARPHVCPKCKETFAQRSNLKRHMLVRHEKPGKCPRCKLRFASEADFEVHWSQAHPHEKKMPLRVPQAHLRCVCGHQLPTLATLHAHEAHCLGVPGTGGGVSPMPGDTQANMPHSCGLCGERFLQRSNLKRHMLVRHEKPCKCPGCKERFATQEEYEVHWQKAHPGETMKKLKLRVRQAHLRCNCNALFDSLKELQVHQRSCTVPNPTTATPATAAAALAQSNAGLVPKVEGVSPNAVPMSMSMGSHAMAMSMAMQNDAINLERMRLLAQINAANRDHLSGAQATINIHEQPNFPSHLIAQSHLKPELSSHPSSSSSSLSREASPPRNFDPALHHQQQLRHVYPGVITDNPGVITDVEMQKAFIPRSDLPIGQILHANPSAPPEPPQGHSPPPNSSGSVVSSRSHSREPAAAASGMPPQGFAGMAQRPSSPGEVSLPLKQEPQTHSPYAAQALMRQSPRFSPTVTMSPHMMHPTFNATPAVTQGIGQVQLSPSASVDQDILAFIRSQGIAGQELLETFARKQKSKAELAALYAAGAQTPSAPSPDIPESVSPHIPASGLASTAPVSSMQNLGAGLPVATPMVAQDGVSIPSLKTEPAMSNSNSISMGQGTGAMSGPMTYPNFSDSLSQSTLNMILSQSSVKQDPTQISAPSQPSHSPVSAFQQAPAPFSQNGASPHGYGNMQGVPPSAATTAPEFAVPGSAASLQTDVALATPPLSYTATSSSMLPTATGSLTYMPTTSASFAMHQASEPATTSGADHFSVPDSRRTSASLRDQQLSTPTPSTAPPFDRFPSTASSNALASAPLELGGESGLTSAQFETSLRRENSLSLSRVSSQYGTNGGGGIGGHMRNGSSASLDDILRSDEVMPSDEVMMQMISDFSTS